MKITEIQIKNFGKLHQISIRPLPGLNVVYGKNESGKSTLRQFITGMLFGIEKQRGKSGRNDVYQQYEPWNSGSYYSGALRFEVAGKPFLLERNFYHKEKSARLVSERDMEELSVEHGDLEMLLGGMKKETYLNTYCVGQAAIETEKEFGGILQNYFVNTSHTGEGGVDLIGARKHLKARKKEAELSCQERTEARRELEEKYRLEQKIVTKDAEQLEVQLRAMKKEGYVPRTADMLAKLETIPQENDSNQMAEYLYRERQLKEEKRSMYFKWAFLALAMLGLLLAVGNFAANLWRMGTELSGRDVSTQYLLAEVLFAVMGVLGLLAAIYFQKKVNNMRSSVQREEQERKEAPQGVDEYKDKVREKEEQARKQAVVETLQTQLWEKKTQLRNIQEELEECRIQGPEELELREQAEAYALALETLENIAGNVYEDTRQQLERETAKILSDITGEKYDRIALDEKMNLMVYAGDRRVYPWQLSRGTMEQMYLALRLGAGRCFTKEEPVPILLDETFASFDDVRLERTLRWLAKQPEQILLFTCQEREIDMLRRLGVSYGKIVLEG